MVALLSAIKTYEGNMGGNTKKGGRKCTYYKFHLLLLNLVHRTRARIYKENYKVEEGKG